jgi:hypothetical protein
MNSIKPEFTEYTDLIEKFGKEALTRRYEMLLKSYVEFIEKMGYSGHIYVNEMTLLYAMCDCFSDILRLKQYHKIENVNEIKMISYEVFWLLRRKPLQIKSDGKEFVYVNEQFVLSRIIQFLSYDKKINTDAKKTLVTLGSPELEFFADTLLYYFKYRKNDAKMIEMFILSFEAGKIFADELKKA